MTHVRATARRPPNPPQLGSFLSRLSHGVLVQMGDIFVSTHNYRAENVAGSHTAAINIGRVC